MPQESPTIAAVLSEYVAGVVGTVRVPSLDDSAIERLYYRLDALSHQPLGKATCTMIEGTKDPSPKYQLFAVAFPFASMNRAAEIIKRLSVIFNCNPPDINIAWIDNPHPTRRAMYDAIGV